MTKELKIAYIGQKGIENVTGGVETHVKELALRAVKEGYKVTVYVRPYTMPEKVKYLDGITVRRLYSLRTKHLDTISYVFLATWHAIFSKFDIIHYHGVGPSLLSFIPRLFAPKIKVIVTFHSLDRQHAKWGLFARLVLRLGEWTACNFSHLTIVVSKELYQYCLKNYHKKTVVIPNGVSNPSYLKPELIKDRFGLRKDDYLLVLSRLVPHKNIHLVIEEFRKIKTDLKLVIAGEESFTKDYVDFLKKTAQNDPRIIFTGPCYNQILQEIIANCLFAVNASSEEGCPTAVLEMASYGKAVLVSDLKVNREIMGENGYYFSLDKQDDLKEKIEQLIFKREALKEKQREISEFILSNYRWDILAPRIFTLYENLFNLNFRLVKNPKKAALY